MLNSAQEALIDKLEAAWSNHPEMRLCQLIVNVLDKRPNDLFYVSDDKLSGKLSPYRYKGDRPS